MALSGGGPQHLQSPPHGVPHLASDDCVAETEQGRCPRGSPDPAQAPVEVARISVERTKPAASRSSARTACDTVFYRSPLFPLPLKHSAGPIIISTELFTYDEVLGFFCCCCFVVFVLF